MAINFDNIKQGLEKSENATAQINNIGVFETVSVELIKFASNNPYAAADDKETINRLAESIKLTGLINPITLNKKSNNEYVLISGERRFKAVTQVLGWKAVPAIVYDGINDLQAALKLHTANLEVREYSSAEKLQYYNEVVNILKEMQSSGKISNKELKAELLNTLQISERQLRKYERITSELSEEEQQEVIDGKMSINDAYQKSVDKKSTKKLIQTDNEKIINDVTNQFTTPEKQEILNCLLISYYDLEEITYYYLSFQPTEREAIKYKLKVKETKTLTIQNHKFVLTPEKIIYWHNEHNFAAID